MGISELKYDGEIVIYDRAGFLLVNAKGTIRTHYIYDGVDDFIGKFRYITRVDLDEWQKHWGEPVPDELDISDVSYWYKEPKASEQAYQAADPTWRADDGEWQQKLRKGEWQP